MQNAQFTPVGRPTLTAARARALLLDPQAHAVFDRLARLAGQAMRAPVSTLGVMERDRVVLASQLRVPEPWASARSLPLESAFCRHVARMGTVLSVADSTRHPAGLTTARLENFPRIAYCGAPVLIGDEAVAVLSVTDARPRQWSRDEVGLLCDLAAVVPRELERLAARLEPANGEDGTPVTADGLISLDREWRFTLLNDRARELLGLGGLDVGRRTFWEIFPGLVGTVFQQECQAVLENQQPARVEDFCLSRGTWFEVEAFPEGGDGITLHIRETAPPDESEPQAADGELRYRQLFDESRTAMIVLDANANLVEHNQAFAALLGRESTNLAGVPFATLVAETDAFDRAFAELRELGAVTDVELAVQRNDGNTAICQLSAGLQTVAGQALYHAALHDITMQKLAQDELVRAAFQDPLTSLPNRLVFMDRLGRVLKHSKRHAGYRFAVLFLDLDNFKQVNDTHGHLVGDALLREVARRLETCIRQEDTVARLSGDEFAILLDTIGDLASVTLVVERVREVLAEPFQCDGRVTGITASIGIAISMSGYDHAEDLLRDADEAMYRAKAGGRNDYIIFDSDMHERAIAQRQLEDDLRAALQRKELALQYHPVVELDSGTVAGLEALIRWSHPERGTLMPADFMPLAEQTGVVVEFGWWVLREACRQLRAWQFAYPNTAFRLTMSVNLSTRQFVHPALVSTIDSILAETGLDPSCLRLDLTEGVVMRNAELAARLLDELRGRGIQICIDDFGTGFTSLRRLREFPISVLKIDPSFVRQLGTDGAGHDVVQTIVALGRSMAIDAIAEGVETPEQLQQLRLIGTRFAQGYLFSLPLDAGDAGALLKQSEI
jgi:diguanylate cyclase (GGDEF)-like protein/PAS domain S-box-containing protein